MGVSTNAEISFGFDLGEDTKLPWVHPYDVEKEDYEFEDGDCDDWYYAVVKKYTPPFEIYDDNGRRLPDITEEQSTQYHKDRRDFKEANPMPFELINTCSCDYPMYILAVPSSNIMCRRGYPISFKPEDLTVNQGDFDLFMDFVKEFFPDFATQEPKWYLSSYYG